MLFRSTLVFCSVPPTEALAAVTVPPFLKTVGSFAICSSVVCGRGCSSVVMATFPFLAFTSMGAISAL